MITFAHMEQLLHYCWKHKMWPATGMATTDGRPVEVLDPGLHNRNAGPDFFNAKVKIGGTLWVGNVEIHDRSSHWYQHGHHTDANYDNVVLHVVGEADRDVQTQKGDFVPQVVMTVPDTVRDNYEELLKTDSYPPCYRIIPDLTRLTVHSWMAALQTERLEQKTIAIQQRVSQAGGSWEEAYFATLARNYGFGINGGASRSGLVTSPCRPWASTATTCSRLKPSSWGKPDCWTWKPYPSATRKMP